MPPFIIAAIPIPESMSVAKLFELHKTVLFGLLDHQVKIISYACDGTENERNVQQSFIDIAETVIEETIPDPHPGQPPLVVRIPVFRGQPIVLIQDSKHALKTFRNNLFSGARLLVLGNFLAMYRDVRAMAFEPGSPLYHRDVEKLDRQDDNAAARLGSAQTLQFLVDRHPEMLGLIIYLFVFMEIPDAYQNRHIPHEERLNMLLRARYFVNMWTIYLDSCPGYLRSQYCISRESLDIVSYLVNGLIGLVVVHRDHYPKIPLLPYLHSTEPCEHVFGICRQIVKDFTMYDFYHMVPKLMLRIRESFLLRSNSEQPSPDVKARAAGYHHTYFDTKKLDITALSHYPTKEDMQNIAKRAGSEADSLMVALGISPLELFGTPSILPSLQLWASDKVFGFEDSEDDNQSFSDDESSVHSIELLQDYVRIVLDDEAVKQQTSSEHDRYDALCNAVLLLSVEDQQRMCVIINDHAILLRNLVSLREQHQTEHASKAVRVRGVHLSNSDECDTDMSLRRRMLAVFHDTNRLSQDRGITTASERLLRWTKRQTDSTGNSLNAQNMAAGNANQALAKRRRLLLEGGIKPLEIPSEAGISKKSPLLVGSWGFVFARMQKDKRHAYKLFLGKVEALYSKGGGKNGKHAAVMKADNIAAVSYIGLQLFEHCYDAKFHAITSQTRPYPTLSYTFIPSTNFFAITKALPQLVTEQSGQTVYLKSNADVIMHQHLTHYFHKLSEVLVAHAKRSKTSTATRNQTTTQNLKESAFALEAMEEDDDLGF
ncbi:uncharacterized protein C8R40DRAFT_1221609 [Lentinula edodes]|uniref:uncharacterized protein n=1 Tax=Lentinula edodes TaxID=5353 RepID=UPI001E8D13E8|nr:uncharacterized protein C8R40DRAFT_1157254 [Lentinula edodes]XP_046079584.1 uncharacterized protein C8R40DRAFT_1221609 [Lentinula edodes]KAH7867803.1 hypothetical protein C8R40DRAFT_1157254 [Lentinula edodes]KAH7868490.1 hypothetical protein C8R40DRAFT_1221609 [Lentinula edodes]